MIPAGVRARTGFSPGTELEVIVEDFSVRLVRAVPGPTLVRVGDRLVARPSVALDQLPHVDLATLVSEERDRWP